ncbi:ATP-binding cassette domain-containing protein [Pelomonas sp. CA6]|nr:ATP-binding cassette domain-containing protein [Pelomonas sp. CA6]
MLALAGLTLRYPDGPLLRFPDLELADGEHLLVQGPSGSGKSSLLALIAGLRSASEGQVLLAGQDLGALRPRQRDAWRAAHLGVVPQRLHLSPALRVWDNLALPYVCAGLAPQAGRIAELLLALGLQGLEDRRPAQLSQGQAQRVALARALLRRPRLVLADEPTANLDDEACAAALDLLADAARQQGGLSLIIASHDARVARHLDGWAGVRRLSLRPHATRPGEPAVAP